MTGYVADLSWKSGARAIEKLDRLRSTMAVNVLIYVQLVLGAFSFVRKVHSCTYPSVSPSVHIELRENGGADLREILYW